MSNEKNKMSVNVQDRVMAFGILLAAIYFIFLSMDFPFESRVFPIAVLSLMAILSLFHVVRSFMLPSEKDTKESGKPFFIHRARFLTTFASIFAYLFLLPFLGYFTSSALFFVVLTWLLNYRNKKILALTLFLFLGFVYAVFILLFERPIPPEFFMRY